MNDGRHIWSVAEAKPRRDLARAWMMWALPDRCDSNARQLAQRSVLMGKALSYNHGDDAGQGAQAPAPPQPAPAPDAAPGPDTAAPASEAAPPPAPADQPPADAPAKPADQPPAAAGSGDIDQVLSKPAADAPAGDNPAGYPAAKPN